MLWFSRASIVSVGYMVLIGVGYMVVVPVSAIWRLSRVVVVGCTRVIEIDLTDDTQR